MKKYTLAIVLLLFCFLTNAQKMNNDNTAAIREIQDRIALKNLVDTFSILADLKEVQAQTLLFTEDATVTTLFNGQKVADLRGRKQIGESFAGFLNNFETVYHMNGQQALTLNGDKASGVSYCMVTLIGIEQGKRMKTAIGVYYHDTYVRQGGKWLIATRESTFSWQEKKAMEQ